MTKEELSSIKFRVIDESLKLEDISDDVYFSNAYKNYVSNSRLKLINPAEGGNPELYFKGSPKIFTESLVFGTLVHQLVLQPDDFLLVEDVILPPGKPGLIADLSYDSTGELPHDNTLLNYCKLVDFWGGNPSASTFNKMKEQIKPFIKNRAKYEKEYHSTHIGKGFPRLVYVNPNNLERIKPCLDSIKNNSKIQSLLNPVDLMGDPLPNGKEATILLDVEASMPGCDPIVLHLKSKLDSYSIDEMGNTIKVNDVKTTSALDYFESSIKKYHYYREMGMYGWLLSKCASEMFDLNNPKLESNFLVVETKPDFSSKVTSCTSAMLRAGMKEFIYLLRLVAYHSMHDYKSYV